MITQSRLIARLRYSSRIRRFFYDDGGKLLRPAIIYRMIIVRWDISEGLDRLQISQNHILDTYLCIVALHPLDNAYLLLNIPSFY